MRARPGEHHQHQLAPCLGLRPNKASIISISWPLVVLEGPTRRASSASAGPLLCLRARPGEHHQHQLAPCLGLRPNKASIISISWPLVVLEGPTRRASSASAGPLLCLRAHHQHQLAPCLGLRPNKASIISISWPLVVLEGPTRRASSASAGPLLHCLGLTPDKAGIISISAFLLGLRVQHHQHQLALVVLEGPTRRAPSASAGPLLCLRARPGEHHQHQLAPCLGLRPNKASIISWPLVVLEGPTRPAASAGPLLCLRARPGEHHQHQLAPCLGLRPNKASIISISWPLVVLEGPTKRASSASAGPLLCLRARQGEHHQHQLAPCLGLRPNKASIISISWPLVVLEGPTRRASSASVGPLLCCC